MYSVIALNSNLMKDRKSIANKNGDFLFHNLEDAHQLAVMKSRDCICGIIVQGWNRCIRIYDMGKLIAYGTEESEEPSENEQSVSLSSNKEISIYTGLTDGYDFENPLYAMNVEVSSNQIVISSVEHNRIFVSVYISAGQLITVMPHRYTPNETRKKIIVNNIRETIQWLKERNIPKIEKGTIR